jgi:hypothetical protein
VRDPDSAGAYASDESPVRTIEILEVDAIGANLDSGVSGSDLVADNANIGSFVTADHSAIARGDDLNSTVLTRKYETPPAFDRAALLIKTRRLRLFALVALLVRRYPRLISLCHRSLFSARYVHTGRTVANG